MAYARRVDGNQSEIVAAFKLMGCSVQDLSKVGHGCPDLIVGISGHNILVEIKIKTGKVQDNQKKWHSEWRGQCIVIRSIDDATKLVNHIRRQGIICPV